MSNDIPEFGTVDPDIGVVPRSAAYALVRDSAGRFLVVRAAQGLFLPGGGVETGESVESAVVREVLEEAGIEVVIDRHVGRAIQHFLAEQAQYRMTADFFTASATRESTEPGEYPVLWLDAGELSGHLYHECHEWAVRRATNGVSNREHS